MQNQKKGKYNTCISCGNNYYVKRHRLHNSKFCSRNCQNIKQYIDSDGINKEYKKFIELGVSFCKHHGEHKDFSNINCKKPRCNICNRKRSREWDKKYWFRNIVRGCKNRAIKKNIAYEIDENFIENLLIKQHGRCNISNIEFIFEKTNKYYTPSIDRIDSKKGYTKDNVQIILRVINIMKTDLNQKEFINICTSIVEFSKL